MAEEDLIYGKNRHFFGGIEPSNMKRFSVHKVNNKPRISVELPDDTVIDGQTLCTVAGAVIRRKVGSYPENEFDGELVKDMKHDDIFIDNVPSDGSDYYYAAFPYTTQGVYNRNKKNTTKYGYNSQYGYLYGFDIDLNDPNQDTRVSYPEDVENHDFRAAKMNFNTGIFDYGDWPSMPGEGFMPRPCVVYGDGAVVRYIDLINKGNVSNCSLEEEKYTNDMVEWGKIYTKRWVENGIYHFRCSDSKIDPDYECWCNYNVRKEEIPHFYTAMYRGSDCPSSDRLRSIYNPSTELSRMGMMYMASRAQDYIDSHGSYVYVDSDKTLRRSSGNYGWCGNLLCDYLLIYDLLVLMAKSNNLSKTYGVSGCSQTINAPRYNVMFKGSNEKTNTPGVIFGMYNFWGSDEGLFGLYKTYGGTHSSMSCKIIPGTSSGDGPGYWRVHPGYSDSFGAITSGEGFDTYDGVHQMRYIIDRRITKYGHLPFSYGSSGSATTYDGRYAGFYYTGVGVCKLGTDSNIQHDKPPMSLDTMDWSNGKVYHRLSLKPVYLPPKE